MASFSSDDETFEIDSILEQRKKKGILHYLVQWKEGDATWEPAERIANDCAHAIEAFLNKQKSKTRRSSSKTRKSSRSRSRSQSRSRKGSSLKAVRKSSRSRSRGRQSEVATTKEITSRVETVQTRRSLSQRKELPKAVEEIKVAAQETKSDMAAVSSSSSPSTSPQTTSPPKESSSTEKSESQSVRTLRSSSMEARQKLEVQRVHNEQRPVREDDSKPRSAIWKVADYAVIVLFIISVIAALFMFLEKFMDLENFKKQAFPSFETLSLRLNAAKDHLVEFFQYGWDRTSDGWDYILQQVKQPESKQPAPPK